ncbi:MAG: protein tyrosine phosphatase [Chloroflexi bacterium]|nr:protein tyrosine phosphatase [Chloroflexota bacterium]
MVSVLFICTGNQYRSPIAAAAFLELLIRDGLAAHWRVGSAGTWTSSGRQAPHEALELARSFGISIDGHVTRMLYAGMLEDADLVLVMEKGHQESIQYEFPFASGKVHLLSQVLEGYDYDIPDPMAAGREAREIIGDLVEMIRLGYENIYRIAESIQRPF